MSETIRLTQLVDAIEDKTSGDKVTMGEILDIFEDRGFGPLLLAPALIVILPTGGIPGIPTLCGLFICLVAGQLIMGRRHPWLPKRIKERSFDRETYQRVVEKIKPTTRFIDRFLYPRLEWVFLDPAKHIISGVCIILALLMIPLELVPFAAGLPALSIALFALGMSAKDGLLAIIAVIPIAILATVASWFF